MMDLTEAAQCSPMTNSLKGRTGFNRILRAAGYSFDGLVAAYRCECAFRQEAWLATVMLPLAFWIGQGWIEITLLAGSVIAVLIVELLNSSVESAVDRVSFERHELAKRAKDMGSAAVLLSLLLCAGIWSAALWQRLST